MSEIALPDYLAAEVDAKEATQLPTPQGYKILIGLPKIE